MKTICTQTPIYQSSYLFVFLCFYHAGVKFCHRTDDDAIHALTERVWGKTDNTIPHLGHRWRIQQPLSAYKICEIF